MRWAWLLIVASCHAPTVVPRDDVVDTGVAFDTADAAESTAPCTGHDEDGDGFPDDCDTCPNLPNPNQAREIEFNPTFASIGKDCFAEDSFRTASKRLFFDPFTELNSRWTVSGSAKGLFQVIKGDELTGGEFAMASETVNVSIIRTAVESTTLVATAVFAQYLGGNETSQAGIFAAGGGAPYRFFACYVAQPKFHLAMVDEGGCVDTKCGFRDVASAKVLPVFAPGEAGVASIGLRISISQIAPGRAEVLCKVFDPRDPISLWTNSSEHAISAVVTDAAMPNGKEVGLFAYRVRHSFGSFEILGN